MDAAKKRAVGQHVDYDTFKNMVRLAGSIANTQHSIAPKACRTQGMRTLQVAVAHLRPLQDPSSAQTGQLEICSHCILFDGLTIVSGTLVSHAPAWRFAPNGLLAKSADSLTLR